MCGVIACCISGFVVINRFGFALKGTQCSYERVYYDSEFGQIKDSFPRWEGLKNNTIKLNQSKDFIDNISGKNSSEIKNYFNLSWEVDAPYFKNNTDMDIYIFDGYYYEGYINEVRKILSECNNFDNNTYLNSTDGELLYNKNNPDDSSSLVGEFIFDLKTCYDPIREKYEKLNKIITNINRNGKAYSDQLDSQIKSFQGISDDLKNYKEKFLNDVNYYIKVAKACGQILVLVYFSILCGIATIGCILLILYTIFEKQGLMNLLMHIVWNSVRFFVFSFFIYGAAFGMLYLGLRDAIAYNMFLFGDRKMNQKSF